MSVLATGTSKGPAKTGEDWGVETGEEEALARLRSWSYVNNIRAGTADFAADGRAELVWSDISDIAAWLWAALDLHRWPQELGMRDDIKFFQEIVEILESLHRRKFLIKETSLEALEGGKSDGSVQEVLQSVAYCYYSRLGNGQLGVEDDVFGKTYHL